MFRRTAAFLLLAWLFGFLWFAVALPGPLGDGRSDAIIVLTGSKGRIEHALDLLRKSQAPRLLVSGVDREVKLREFEVEYGVSPDLMRCCVTLGYSAYDTRSNANEAADWVAANKARTVRLVTSDWHMRRAAFEMGRVLPSSVIVQQDGVPSHGSFEILVLEYHKFLASLAVAGWKAIE